MKWLFAAALAAVLSTHAFAQDAVPVPFDESVPSEPAQSAPQTIEHLQIELQFMAAQRNAAMDAVAHLRAEQAQAASGVHELWERFQAVSAERQQFADQLAMRDGAVDALQARIDQLETRAPAPPPRHAPCPPRRSPKPAAKPHGLGAVLHHLLPHRKDH